MEMTQATVPGMTLDEMARELYEDACQVAPSWDQLGGVTMEVWLERARDGVVPEGVQPLVWIGRDSEGRRA